ncbi:MAG: hypothetical protein JRH20_08175 [Deltaproteobacteria bacterium]|nr:hypothetical protein [Deltaproteobacteria bacterium]
MIWLSLLLGLSGCRFDTSGPQLQLTDGGASDRTHVFWDAANEHLQFFDSRVDADGLSSDVGDGDAKANDAKANDGDVGDGGDGGAVNDMTSDTTPALDQSLLVNVGRLVFAEDGLLPKLRRWDSAGLSWLAGPVSPNAALDLRWVQTQLHDDGEVLLLKGFDPDGEERTEVWQLTGGSWAEVSALRQEPSNDDLWQIRDMALGREEESGDLLLVVGAQAKAPRFATFSNGQWSSLERLPAAVSDGDVVWWVELVARPRSDELMLLYSDKADDLFALRWDGQAWEESSHMKLTNDLNRNEDTDVVSTRAFDGAYEGDSGDLFVAFGRNGGKELGFHSAIWSGGAWKLRPLEGVYGGHTYFVDLEADPRPGSDNIAAVFVDLGGGSERLAVGTWDGESWVGLKEYDSQIYDYDDDAHGDFPSAVGWADGTAVCVYGDEGGTLKWLSWTQSSSDWTPPSELPVLNMGKLESVLMHSQVSPQSGVVTLLSDDSQRLFGVFFDGEQWQRTGVPALTSQLPSNNTLPFDLDLR